MSLNSSPCHFPVRELSDDHDQHNRHNHFAPDHSQSSMSFRFFFNSGQAQLGCKNHCRSLHSYHHQLDNNNCSYNQGGSSAPAMEDGVESGLKLTLWEKEDCEQHYDQRIPDRANDQTNPKWMAPKKRLMMKMKNSEDHTSLTVTNNSMAKLEDQNIQPLTDHSSSNTSSYSNSTPIRVCADCNTTKTPLWRSGPNGPKSLCNACGIRQRKARRALVAAASGQPPVTKIKVQHKDNMMRKIKGQVKKPRRTTAFATGSSDGSLPNNRQKKLRFEDFLVNLSKKLSVHRVFPDEEKDAAILLMAISSGLLHG